jgi:rhomboid protease GluP
VAQIVGQHCNRCGEVIDSTFDGEFCARCRLPMHHHCKQPDYEPDTPAHCSACGGNPSHRMLRDHPLPHMPRPFDLPPFGEPVVTLPNPTARFSRLLLSLTPRIVMTPLFAGVNVLLFVIMVLAGVPLMNPSIDDLLRWGANFGPKTTAGEWWRLETCTFEHVGIVHIVMNMLVLITGGPLVERMLGNAGFLIMYLISGLCGALASLFWSPLTVSAGASGAIFGVYGALLGILLRQQGTVPSEAMTRLRNSGLGFLLMNLIYGLSQPHIDFAAHLGGLAGGFICGLIMGQPFTPETGSRRPLRNVVALFVGGAIIAGGVFGASVRYKDLAAAQREIDEFAATEEKALGAFNSAVAKAQQQQLPDSEFADLLERDILPPWRAARDRLSALKNLPPQLQSTVGRVLEYARLRQEAWEMFASALRENNNDKARQAIEIQKQADAAAQKIGKEEK